MLALRSRLPYRQWLASRRLPWFATLLALLLCAPSLTTGFQLDDLFQRVLLLELSEELGTASDMFGVLTGDVERNNAFRDMGVLPWWSTPDVKFHFFRPVTTFTHRVDYWLWPDSPVSMHVHNLLWLGALILVAARFYRDLLLPAWVAGLATLLFALDDAHAGAAAWLANRNALVATTLGVGALLAYHRYRHEGWRTGLWISTLCLAGSLSAAEIGAATVAYLLAYALFLDRAPLRERLRALVPACVVSAVWLSGHQLAGYGAAGSGFYLDPFDEPTVYLGELVVRAPVLVAAQWGILPADAYATLPPDQARSFALLSVVFLVIVVLAVTPLLRRSRTARFWTVGMVLSAVPVAATMPANRLLFFIGLGGMGLMAEWLSGLADGSDWAPAAPIPRRAFMVLAILLVAAHLVISPLIMPLATLGLSTLGVPAQVAFESVPDDPGLAEQDLVIVNSPEFLVFVSGLLSHRVLEGLPLPRRTRALSAWPSVLELEREDSYTLRMTIDGGAYAGALGRLFRGSQTRFQVRETVDLAGLEVEILELLEDRPHVVPFRFDRPLEDPGLRWVQWLDGEYVPFTPPVTGQTVRLSAARGPMEMGPAELAAHYRAAQEKLEQRR